jgi:WD40 repeat protein
MAFIKRLFIFSLIAVLQIKLTHSQDGNLLYEGEVKVVEWSPDGSMIAVQGRGGVRIFTRSGELLVTLEAITTPFEHLTSQGLNREEFIELGLEDTLSIEGVSWSPDSQKIVAPFYSTTGGFQGSGWKIWNVATGAQESILYANTQGLSTGLEWSADGTKIAATALEPFYNGCACSYIYLWNIPTNREALTSINKSFARNEMPIYTLAWHPESQMLASGGADEQIHLWDMESVELLRSYNEHEADVNDLAWSMDGELIASASDDSTIRVWQAENTETIAVLLGHQGGINAIDWNSDSTFIASSGDDAAIHIWDVESGELVTSFEGHEAEIIALDWSPDGKYLVTASLDNTVRIWEVALP